MKNYTDDYDDLEDTFLSSIDVYNNNLQNRVWHDTCITVIGVTIIN